jgi:hypothetical protein
MSLTECVLRQYADQAREYRRHLEQVESGVYIDPNGTWAADLRWRIAELEGIIVGACNDDPPA